MKRTEQKIDFEAKAVKKGRITSIIVHAILMGLLVFPFMQMTTIETPMDVKIVMDFSSGSSNEGSSMAKKAATSTKAAQAKKKQSKKVLTAKKETPVLKTEVKEEVEAVSKPPTQPTIEEKATNTEKVEDANEAGVGSGDKGSGEANEGSASNGNGKGFIEGTGVLTRAVIARGNTKALAHKNGTLILKICINKRGLLTYAEWDKEQSSIKDSKIARQALDNVLNYRFEKDYDAPSKECGRLTYIFKVD